MMKEWPHLSALAPRPKTRIVKIKIPFSNYYLTPKEGVKFLTYYYQLDEDVNTIDQMFAIVYVDDKWFELVQRNYPEWNIQWDVSTS